MSATTGPHPTSPAGRDPHRDALAIDVVLSTALPEVPRLAAQQERAGCGTLWVGELAHDPFLQALESARATKSVAVGTGIAVAFARNPMSVAYSAWDLQQYCGGRFALGLGTQVKAHIERRFAMPWSEPARRMSEYVAAVRTIWQSWRTGDRLRFEGEFYTHTLMSPVFVPEASQLPLPPIFLAAVGPRMCETVGQTADGFLAHPFSTARFLLEVALPSIARGAAAAGRDAAEVRVCAKTFAAVGDTEEECAAAVSQVRRQIAFYASTPAYRPVLDLHGWGELQPSLTALSKLGQWDEMARLVDDEMLQQFAVTGTPAEAGREIRRRFESWADSVIVLGADSHLPQLIDAARS
jgi:probable F420-dependent oxidoreductase